MNRPGKWAVALTGAAAAAAFLLLAAARPPAAEREAIARLLVGGPRPSAAASTVSPEATILCLGDEALHAPGLPAGSAWPERLAADLAVAVRVEGREGWSSEGARLALPGLLARVRPREVVIALGAHDAAPFPVTERALLAPSRPWIDAYRATPLARRLRSLLPSGRRWIEAAAVVQSPRPARSGESSRVPPSRFRENLLEMLRQARAAGSHVVLLAPLLGHGERPLDAWRATMREAAAEEGAGFVGIPALESRSGGSARRFFLVVAPEDPQQEPRPDFTRLSSAGHARVAQVLGEALRMRGVGAR